MSLVGVQVADASVKEISREKWMRLARVVWLGDGSGLIVSAIPQPGTSDKGQLWQVDYPGGQSKRITNDLNDYFDVSLTADSKTLVTAQSEVISNIWVGSTTDISRAKQITFSSGAYDGAFGLTWSPDGRIVYSTNTGGVEDIWIMRSDGTDQKQLTSAAVWNEGPSVTPDGRYIVFTSDRSGVPHIWRMGLDGSNPVQLTKGVREYGANCSPDGKWVVYASSPEFGSGIPTIWKISIDGGEPIQITKKYSTEPKVSPDGKLIACWYRGDDLKMRSRIALIPFEGGEPIKVLERPPNVYLYSTLRWTADGRAVIFAAGAGSTSNIWRQPIDGGQALQLTDVTKPDLIYTFDVSRDGRQIVYSRGREPSDAVLIGDFR